MDPLIESMYGSYWKVRWFSSQLCDRSFPEGKFDVFFMEGGGSSRFATSTFSTVQRKWSQQPWLLGGWVEGKVGIGYKFPLLQIIWKNTPKSQKSQPKSWTSPSFFCLKRRPLTPPQKKRQKKTMKLWETGRRFFRFLFWVKWKKKGQHSGGEHPSQWPFFGGEFFRLLFGAWNLFRCLKQNMDYWWLKSCTSWGW